MKISEFLTNDLKNNNLTINELAINIGLSRPKIYYLLGNKQKMGNKSIRLIAKYYNLTIEQVVAMNDYK